ncbi:MAG: phage major capsid protein [Oscillospiraceae bacterium]|nr:phage major capsid protein [Oscillospiraceae bacterium]
MTHEEIEARKAEINEILNGEGEFDLDALEAEVRELNQKDEELKRAAALEAETRAAVAAGAGTVIKDFPKESEERKMNYTTDSIEYRNGFLKSMLDMELSAEERDAISFVATTTDATYGSGNVLPRTMLNQIWDLIEDQHSILGDITMYRTGTILEVAKRTEISQGDAKSVNENAANDDEVNTFAKVTLSGKDFSKHVNISYAMAKMSVDSFEAFLTNEIADRIGAALAADVVAQIKTDYYSTGNAVTSANEKKLVWTDLAGALALLKNAKGPVVVYGQRATIYNYLVGMADTTGRPIYQPNAQAGAEGTLIGYPVKVEEAVDANKLLIGYPQQVVGNMVQDIMVEAERDIKKHVITYAGYARFECKLMAPKAFALLTVDQGT